MQLPGALLSPILKKKKRIQFEKIYYIFSKKKSFYYISTKSFLYFGKWNF